MTTAINQDEINYQIDSAGESWVNFLYKTRIKSPNLKTNRILEYR
jgi:hypothetical protein